MAIQIDRRPLLVALFALIIGISAKSEFSGVILLFPLLFFARSLRSWTVALLFLILGYGIAPSNLPILSKVRTLDGPILISSEGEDRPNSVQSTAQVGGLNVLLSAPPGSHLHRGDLLRGPVTVYPVDEGQEALDRSIGVQGTCRLARLGYLRTEPLWYRMGDWVKDDFRSFVALTIPAETGIWVDSLWLRGGSLPKQDRDLLAKTGAYTLMSASGLNVFVLWGITVWVFGSWLKFSRKLQLCVASILLIVYCFTTGLHESTIRASLSCLVLSGAFLIRREGDLISVTALCGLVYLIIYPRLSATLGFQLSMAIPIAVGFYLPLIRQEFKAGEKSPMLMRLGQSWRLGAIVFLVGQPLIAYNTGSFGFSILVTSLSMAMIGPLVLGTTLCVYLVKFFCLNIAITLMKGLITPLVEGLHQLIGWTAQIVPTYSVPAFSPLWLLVYFGLWTVAWRPREISA